MIIMAHVAPFILISLILYFSFASRAFSIDVVKVKEYAGRGVSCFSHLELEEVARKSPAYRREPKEASRGFCWVDEMLPNSDIDCEYISRGQLMMRWCDYIAFHLATGFAYDARRVCMPRAAADAGAAANCRLRYYFAEMLKEARDISPLCLRGDEDYRLMRPMIEDYTYTSYDDTL